MQMASLTTTSRARGYVRYAACLRVRDIFFVQGSALLGAAFAFGHRAVDHLGLLTAFGVANAALIAHVFVVNDWANLGGDRVDPAKAASVFTARGVTSTEMIAVAAGLLGVSLLLFSGLGLRVFLLAAGIGGLSALYSLPPFNWKARPVLSSAAHLAGGVLHFLLGYGLAGPIDRRGLVIAAFFGLTFAAGHLTQELRDYDADVRHGISTNAARFGKRRAWIASLALFSASQLLLFTLALQGLVPRALTALVLLYPLHLWWSIAALRDGLGPASVTRLQMRYRCLYLVIGSALVASLWIQ
jgi:4-hydroxybenzoate polyprenyltransferase